MTITFRVYYFHHARNKTGAFGVHPDDIRTLEAWRAWQGHATGWNHTDHPTTGQRLEAFSPVQPGTAEMDAVIAQGIHHGLLCWVNYRAVQRGGQVQMKFVDIQP